MSVHISQSRPRVAGACGLDMGFGAWRCVTLASYIFRYDNDCGKLDVVMSTRAHHIPYESHLVQASLRTRHARRPLRSFVRVVTRFGRPEVRAAARLRLCRAARLHPSLVCAVCGRGFVKQRPILTPLIAPHLAKARGYLVDARIERAHLGV